MSSWNRRSRPAGLVAVLLALASLAPPTRATGADDAERAAIAAERAAIDARFAARERECLQRFVVTSCVDDAKRERRIGLDSLKARQLALDEARRRARTDERSAEIAAKAAEDANRQRATTPAPASSPSAPDAAPQAATPNAVPASAAKKASAPRQQSRPASASAAKTSRSESAEERAANEAHNRAAYESRQREAAAHRAEVLENTHRRLTEKPPARSLPVPSPASAANR